MTVIAPVTALTTTAVPVIFGLAAGERPGTRAMTGITLAVLAILLVSATVAPSSDGSAWRLRGAIPTSAIGAALASGVCFGGFYVIIRLTSPAAGVWPLAASRSASSNPAVEPYSRCATASSQDKTSSRHWLSSVSLLQARTAAIPASRA